MAEAAAREVLALPLYPETERRRGRRGLRRRARSGRRTRHRPRRRASGLTAADETIVAERTSLQRFDALLRRFARARLLVVGDLMLDQFIWGRVERISPEAPVPVVQVTRESFHLGGAANVVHNIRALGGHADGVRRRRPRQRRPALSSPSFEAIGAGTAASRHVPRHDHRAQDSHHRPQPAGGALRSRDRPTTHAAACGACALPRGEHVWDFDAVVLSDYGKGVITAELLAALAAARARRPVPPDRRSEETQLRRTIAG